MQTIVHGTEGYILYKRRVFIDYVIGPVYLIINNIEANIATRFGLYSHGSL